MTNVLMERMSWPEFRDALEGNPIVFLPCGATEQHGPHLPLSVDCLLPSALCRDVATAVGGIVAPTLSFGYKSMPKSGGGPHFPGTLNLDATTLIAMVRDVIRELARHGVRKICCVVGHYENQWIVTEGIDLAMRECGHTGLKVMRLEYWDFCTEETLDKVFPDGFPGVALELAFTVYGATKAFVQVLNQGLNVELRPKGVYVQAVLPAATRTDIWEKGGKDVNQIEGVMEVGEMVDAALVGFDRREQITIPPLPDDGQWNAFDAARKAMLPNFRQTHAASRYRAA